MRLFSALTAHYQYGYDSQGNIVRTVDIFGEREYIYTYEDGKLVCAAEYAITFSEDGFITARSKVITLRHSYNEQGAMVRKTVTFPDGTEQVTLMDTDSEDAAATHIRVNGAYISSISKTDAFGRKEFDELQLGSGLLSRHFRYHDGKITDEHKANGKVKSAPTTHLVSRITFSDGRSLSYEYDAEERITEVVERDGDTVVTTTAYTYDAQGQLLTETVNGESVNRMFYDAYGNILSKNGVAYQYGDSRWKDKLTAYDGQYISYDSQGNPIRYLGHELRWEKGRQLKSFDGNTYTYNANGIRTSKTIDGVTHTYILDGVKVLREIWDGNTLIPLYDNEESVCGILFNDVPYYFQKNLQGDIIAITNAAGLVLARYAYDAWGKCTITDRVNLNPIVDINPFRYRSYYYDPEIQMYYLQSRYYDPEVGRFINGDDPMFAVLSETALATNLFAYCNNNPISRSDFLGFASYTNTATPLENNKWKIKTVIKVWKKKFTYNYDVNNGLISFPFDSNNYWSVVWRGVAKTLAEAMYKAVKGLSKNYLKGRTIGGIHAELFIHWALYTLGILRKNTNPADIGGVWGSGKDPNAWIFETANVIALVARLGTANPVVHWSVWRDFARYFL